jgi:hypothetical protein
VLSLKGMRFDIVKILLQVLGTILRHQPDRCFLGDGDLQAGVHALVQVDDRPPDLIPTDSAEDRSIDSKPHVAGNYRRSSCLLAPTSIVAIADTTR